MGKKLIISASVIFSSIIFSLMYTYFYPWLYNKVNNVTKRGQDLDDSIDIVNVFIMFIIVNLAVLVTGAFLGGISILKLKNK